MCLCDNYHTRSLPTILSCDLLRLFSSRSQFLLFEMRASRELLLLVFKNNQRKQSWHTNACTIRDTNRAAIDVQSAVSDIFIVFTERSARTQIYARRVLDEIADILGILSRSIRKSRLRLWLIQVWHFSETANFPSEGTSLRTVYSANGARQHEGEIPFWRVEARGNALFSARATLRRVLHHNAFWCNTKVRKDIRDSSPGECPRSRSARAMLSTSSGAAGPSPTIAMQRRAC